MKNNFVEYLREYYNNEYDDMIELLEYEINKHIYYYGEHFRYPKENIDIIYKFKKIIYFHFLQFLKFLKIFKFEKYKNTKIIISNASAGNGRYSINNFLEKEGYKVIVPIYNSLSSFSFFLSMYQIESKLYFGNIKDITSIDFFKKIKNLELTLYNLYNTNYIKALFVGNDCCFHERLLISVFKKLNKVSFLFNHGYPGRYNKIDENRCDFLIVYGKKIKEQYINAGIKPTKIFISGYGIENKNIINLRFAFDNILVISTGLVMLPTGMGNGIILSDRGNLLTYIYSIEKTLKKMGISKVRFRPHPSENKGWYKKNIDMNFFTIDNENFINSLKKSTLVIGPTSTVFIDSLLAGVNYVIYEPNINGINLYNWPIVKPFDGNDKRIPVAKNENELYNILYNKEKIDISCSNDYINNKFDISFVKNIINDFQNKS